MTGRARGGPAPVLPPGCGRVTVAPTGPVDYAGHDMNGASEMFTLMIGVAIGAAAMYWYENKDDGKK